MSDLSVSLAFGLPPERALEYFRAKGQRISSRAEDMIAGAHARAFTVAGVMKAEVLEDIRGAIDLAMAEGKTYQQFLAGLKPQLQAKGWWGVPHDPETGEILRGRAMTPRRLQTVYQTNLQSAYMAGRYKAQLENADRRPYWQYVAVLDSRTRPRHRSMHGRIFRYDDPVWSVLYPPNGYNCRCRIRALTPEEFKAGGGMLSKGEAHMETITVPLKRGPVAVRGYRDPGTGELFLPDPGFDTNPGQSAYGTDIALARRVQAMKSPDLRRQVWQALNNSPQRQREYTDFVTRTLESRRGGNDPQVVGFVDDQVAAFMELQQPRQPPVRVAAITGRQLLHADSPKHTEGGIGLNLAQYQALPSIIVKPDAVYWDKLRQNFVYVRELADGGVIYAVLETELRVKGAGQIDALINAFRLSKEARGRLDTTRYVKMGN